MVVVLALAGCTLSSTKRASLGASNLAVPVTQQALVFQIKKDFGLSLSSKEKEIITTTERRALEYGAVGRSINWVGDSPKVLGTIIAYRPFRVGQSNCRRFEHRLTTATGNETAAGTACQQGDSSWKLIK